MDLPGLRNTPSLSYASFTPAFHFDAQQNPFGGFFHDGRAATLADQAEQPFLASFEMANADASEVLSRLEKRPYFTEFEAVFGAGVATDPTTALKDIGLALAAFETEDARFHPFSSKFDQFMAGKVQLSPDETAGYALFLNPSKGNCTACHVAAPSSGPILFTDFSYDNIGVPRNWTIPANAANTSLPYVPANGLGLGAPNYRYYDMGLCGPLRTDQAISTRCGLFKVPSLRNVALRHRYFHNGVFSNLQDVVAWYMSRDSNPTRWYQTAAGTPDVSYNDLPVLYDGNVNILEVPYLPGGPPPLTPREMNQLVLFLCTLSDGYDPTAAPTSQPQQCQAAQAALQNP